MIVIALPWPHKDLRPNARPHWAEKAKAVKQARALAGWTANEIGIRRGDPDIPSALKVTAVFCPPSRRRFDDDNMLSSCKSYFDGIADAIGIDDSKWQIAMRREGVVKGGAVRIELEAA